MYSVVYTNYTVHVLRDIMMYNVCTCTCTEGYYNVRVLREYDVQTVHVLRCIYMYVYLHVYLHCSCISLIISDGLF